MSEESHAVVSREMREAGRALKDQAAFEVDLSTGEVRWANEFALSRLGYTAEQFSSLSIFDLCPEKLHEKLREVLASAKEGKFHDSALLPVRCSSGRVAWWFTYSVKIKYPAAWASADHVQDTDPSGPGWAFMLMQSTFVTGALQRDQRLFELEEWAGRLEEEQGVLSKSLADMGGKLDSALSASKNAAQASLEAKNESAALRGEISGMVKDIEDSQAQHTGEILKLISSDQSHDARLDAFEKQVKDTAEAAIDAMTKKSEETGQGLSKKITIPISLVVALAAVFQLVITNWSRVQSWFN